jgi:Spy/CpxP family protein refolding chaperone
MSMHWLSVTGSVVVLFVAAAASGGCGSRSASPPAAAPGAPTEVTSAQAGPQTGEDAAGATLVDHHQHHHGGVPMFLVMSLDSLGVTDEQRAAITKIQQDLAVKLEPEHAAQGTVLSILADGVAAGAVDKAKVDAAIAKLDVATAGPATTATSEALNQLHAVLTPPQRKALVDKLQAHWQVWQDANAEAGAPAAVASDLRLTADQMSRIRAAVQTSPMDATKSFDRALADSRMRDFGTAFEREAFDAEALNDGARPTADLAGHGIRRMARVYEAAAPVLTPDQRTKAAARLRVHAAQEEGK